MGALRRFAALGAMSMLLAACGSGDVPAASTPSPTPLPGQTATATPAPTPPGPTRSPTCSCATETSTATPPAPTTTPTPATPLVSCCGFDGGCRSAGPTGHRCFENESAFYPPYVCDPDQLACAIPATLTPTPSRTPTCGACAYPTCAAGDSVACEDPRCLCGCACISPTPTLTPESTPTLTATPIELQATCCQLFSPESCFVPSSPQVCNGELFTDPYLCSESTGRCEVPPSPTPNASG